MSVNIFFFEVISPFLKLANISSVKTVAWNSPTYLSIRSCSSTGLYSADYIENNRPRMPLVTLWEQLTWYPSCYFVLNSSKNFSPKITSSKSRKAPAWGTMLPN